ncbi:MAG: RHS repeat-associated core domain-containing protein, partial [Azonexus sp.]|nr:RHS repeat-associated core domain-containing protein [Azonexus sp.]
GVIEGMDFGAFGERRGYVDPRNLPVFPVSTNRGFTGHEMLDGLDVVHMNGRIYDSKLGRFLQADPIIQEPNNGQNFNRYSYVLNNPLSYTDPSGFSFFRKFRTFAAIAVAIAAPYAAAALQGVAVASLAPGTAFAAAAAGGFASGVISGGGLRSGLFGAFSATLFFGIGETFASVEGSGSFFGTGLEKGDFAAKVLAHGIAGGVMAGLQGGNFGHGFVSAGVTQAFSGQIDRIQGRGAGAGRIAAAAALGGTASVLSGGKFANGALTGAFSRAFNDALPHNEDLSGTTVTESRNGEPHQYQLGPTRLCWLSTEGCTLPLVLQDVDNVSIPFVYRPDQGRIVLPPFGDPIFHRVDRDNLIIFNITLEGHIFHPGQVVHTLSIGTRRVFDVRTFRFVERQFIQLTTIGSGTGRFPIVNEIVGAELFGQIHILARLEVDLRLRGGR